MKKIKKIIIILIASTTIFAQEKNNKLPSFRNFEWGSSPEIIKKNEPAQYLQTFSGFGTYALSYRGEFLGLKSRIDYSFKDSMLVETSHQIKADLTYESDFKKIRDHFTNLYGKPDYWAIRQIESEQYWVRETDLGTFRGPELFWELSDGFIAIQSSRFIEEITITVLFVYHQKISEYGSADVFTFQY